jgi:hypothetical protein
VLADRDDAPPDEAENANPDEHTTRDAAVGPDRDSEREEGVTRGPDCKVDPPLIVREPSLSCQDDEDHGDRRKRRSDDKAHPSVLGRERHRDRLHHHSLWTEGDLERHLCACRECQELGDLFGQSPQFFARFNGDFHGRLPGIRLPTVTEGCPESDMPERIVTGLKS